jgi:NhaA family Na+:H+ antiporter
LEIESASGVVLLICTVVALVLANSPLAEAFAEVWQTRLTLAVGSFELNKPLLLWINDGLMTAFFFVVGLEIKRELVAGELRDRRKAALPVMAALGGMIAPAVVYLLLRGGQPGEAGWGIPMATDIAFVVGFLALLGPRVPIGLKILLLSVAIADDIGAVLVIACFYSTNISLVAVGLAALGFGLTYLLNQIGVRRVPVYVVVGAGIWLAVLKSGVHPTVAGVLLGLLTPGSAWVGDRALVDILNAALNRLRSEKDGQIEHHHHPVLGQLELASREAVSPLERLEMALHPWVAFGIMPVFALANAGVVVEPTALSHPVAVAVAVGLVCGKPLGILLFSWLGVRVGLARLPTGVNWRIMLGAGCLAGIGFTMSLFIAGLALDGELLDDAKIGTLTGSALSAAIGFLLLLAFLPRRSGGVAGRARAKAEGYQPENPAGPYEP